MPASITDNQTLLSPVVQFGPSDLKLQYPATLSFPHCASLSQGNWLIRLLALRPSTGASPRGPCRNGGFEKPADELTSSYSGAGSSLPVSGIRNNQAEVLTWQVSKRSSKYFAQN